MYALRWSFQLLPFSKKFFLPLTPLTSSPSSLTFSACLRPFPFADVWLLDHCHLRPLMHDIVSISWMPRRKKKRRNGAWQKGGPRGLGLNGAEHLPYPPPGAFRLTTVPPTTGPSLCSGLMGAVEEFLVENQGRFHPQLWLKPERAGGWNSRAVVAAMWKEADYFLLQARAGKAGQVAWTWATQGPRENRNWMIRTTKDSGDNSVIEVSEMSQIEIAARAITSLWTEWNHESVAENALYNPNTALVMRYMERSFQEEKSVQSKCQTGEI